MADEEDFHRSSPFDRRNAKERAHRDSVDNLTPAQEQYNWILKDSTDYRPGTVALRDNDAEKPE